LSKQIKIPLETKPYYNAEAIAESIASDDMWDCYLEPVPGVGLVTRRRPGLTLFGDTGTNKPGDGLFYWDAKNMVIAVSGGEAFNVSSLGVCTQLTGTFPSSGVNTVFADGQTLAGLPWLYMAANGLVYTTDGATLITPAGASYINAKNKSAYAPPSSATHVAWINMRFVANEPGTNRFYFTDTDPATKDIENDYWISTDNPLTCEARGDKLSALFTAWQEIYCWGTEGLEIWQDDGITPFSPIPGAFAETGIEGPYAYGKIDNTIFALCVIEGKRCVIKLNQRSPLIVSEPIARILAEMSTVSDAICDIISVGGISVALFSFPTAGESWAYDYKNDTWSRWGYWNLLQSGHERFLGQHSCFAKTWNKHLIQSRIDGKIYELDRNVFMDDANPMVSYRRTGWIDRGTWNRKRVSQLVIKGKVYPNNASPTSTLMFRWRDNGSPVWSNYVDISLNPDTQGNFVVPMNRMGMYRSRQYEFRLSDNVDLVLVGATEDIEVMRN
jgi:hypothetical protein